MARQRYDKLKIVLNEVLPGFLVDTRWLAARNIDRKLAHWYVRNGWLEPVTQGVYRRPLPSVHTSHQDPDQDWHNTILAIQAMGYEVHIGGRTALSAQAFLQYLPLGRAGPVHVYGNAPTWLKRLPGDVSFRVHANSIFGDETAGIWNAPGNKITLVMSMPERAILEVLDEVPKAESFQMVDSIFEEMVSLRPELLAQLLKSCTRVKVKRLFFVFADRHKHAWRKYLSASDFDLGSGPRSLMKGGAIHPDYQISVPAHFLGPSSEEAEDGP